MAGNTQGLVRAALVERRRHLRRTRPRPFHCSAGEADDTLARPSLADSPTIELKGQVKVPGGAGIYAIYNSDDELQFIGISRKVATSIKHHLVDYPELVASVKTLKVEGAKAALTEAWTAWMQEAADTSGIPPGNQQGNTTFTSRRPAGKPEIKLTAGKGLDDVSVPLEELIDRVVQENRVVAFIKGTRVAPECGFSQHVLGILGELGVEFEAVNCLDDVHNPGLRDTIKEYSQWPTIPQLYVRGEFVGGCDIVTEMHASGELAATIGGEE
mmetsp:Transcript_19839/g.64526  ORF Transcript_19839/g.64526 Transcript_19839/m.64526 type:complete len:271 (-) Transcript_19839:78-890(-)